MLLFKHVVQEFITAVTQNYLQFMPIFMDTVTSFITVVMSPSWVLFRVVVLTRLEHICTSFHIISRKHSHKYQYLTVAHVMSCFSKISQSILVCTTLLLLLLWFSCFARCAALFYSIDASLFTTVLVNIY